MKKILFLDLENTVIDTWYDQNIVSDKVKIKEWIERHFFDEVVVFSFAIWNDDDKIEFKIHIKNRLESVFEIKFNEEVFSIEDIQRFTQNQMKCLVDRDDIFAFGKHQGFINTVMQRFKGNICVLLDDMVSNTRFTDFDSNTVMVTKNVKTI